MPIGELAPEAIEAVISAASPDVLFIYDEIGLRPLVQAHLVTAGCNSVRRLAGFARTEETLREALAEQLGLKENESLQARADVADVSQPGQMLAKNMKRKVS